MIELPGMNPHQPESTCRAFWCLLLLAGMTCLSAGDAIGPPPTFDDLEKHGGLIFKGTALSSQPVQDPSLPTERGLDAVETRFQVVSMVKGKIEGTTIRFHHYEAPPGPFPGVWSPQTFTFQTGRTYLVATGPEEGKDGAVQFQTHLSFGTDVLLCVDAHPVSGSKLKDMTWNELLNLLQDHDSKDAIYAIDRLKERAQKLRQGLESSASSEMLDRAERDPDPSQKIE
jgi:hypothetical protein